MRIRNHVAVVIFFCPSSSRKLVIMPFWVHLYFPWRWFQISESRILPYVFHITSIQVLACKFITSVLMPHPARRPADITIHIICNIFSGTPIYNIPSHLATKRHHSPTSCHQMSPPYFTSGTETDGREPMIAIMGVAPPVSSSWGTSENDNAPSEGPMHLHNTRRSWTNNGNLPKPSATKDSMPCHPWLISGSELIYQFCTRVLKSLGTSRPVCLVWLLQGM